MSSLDELPTERPNPHTRDIDRLTTLGVVEALNAEDLTVAAAVHEALPELARAVDVALERWRQGGRIILFGAGTSGRLATLDAAELGPTFGVPTERYTARMAGGAGAFLKSVEGAEDDAEAGAQAADDLAQVDVAFGIAASGRTPWVLAAMRRARARGAATIGLACVPRPEIADCVDALIVVDTGPEAVSGSTRLKAGTAQKLVLNGFSTALMIRLGKVYSNLMVDVQATNAKLRRRAVRLVEQAVNVDAARAEQAVAEASGSVKTAIAMVGLNVSADEATRRLARADGYLRAVLGDD